MDWAIVTATSLVMICPVKISTWDDDDTMMLMVDF
jgi:hypothetical protein